MKRIIIGAVATIWLAVSAVLTGCSGEASKTANVEVSERPSSSKQASVEEIKLDKVYTMQIAHAQPIDNPRHISLEVFKELVETKTNGGILVEIYPAGQLGTEKGMLEQTCSGVIQGFRGGQFEVLPKLLIFTLPFLCENSEEISRLLNSDFAKKICVESRQNGVIILGLGDAGGFRQFSNNLHPIRKPDDLTGLMMRTNGMDTVHRTFRALGAKTITIPYSDLYMELKKSKANGQENPWVNIASMKFYEVQKYFTQINYQFHPEPFYVNLEWYRSLPMDYQEILEQCTAEMMKVNNQAIADREQEALDTIKANAEVHVLTEEERQAFKDVLKVVYDEYIVEGKMTREELDTLRAIVAGEKYLK